MKILILIFLLMALYGTVTAQLGGAALSLVMAGLVYYARGHFDRQDRAAAADPAHARCPTATEQDLDAHDCECQRSRF